MKFIIALSFVALFALAACDRQSEWAENSKQCAQKHNIVEEDIKKVITGEIKPADVSPNMKCYFLCMSEKEGITKDGVFQPQALADKIATAPNKADLVKAITACKDVKGTDNCDTSFKIMSCMAMNKAANV